MWDPSTYLRYTDERSRPFFDLLARVDATDPKTVVDLGCGPGTLTTHLSQRWPTAQVIGVDSSPDMIAAAQQENVAQRLEAAQQAEARVRFEVADVRDWHASTGTDVIIANALLQWVPGHHELLTRWISELHKGAQLAFQVPGNFDAPSHRIIRELAASPRWREQLDGILRGADAVDDAIGYATHLVALGCEVDAWETTYLHQLPASGDDHPVLRWVEGTALTGVRSTLDDANWAAFRAELNPRFADVYPIRDGRAYFPFRRIFVVARV